MEEILRQRLLKITDALVYYWLHYQGALQLLKAAHIPDYRETIETYAELEANKARAKDKFAEVNALLQLSLQDSTALEKLSEALFQSAPTTKPN